MKNIILAAAILSLPVAAFADAHAKKNLEHGWLGKRTGFI